MGATRVRARIRRDVRYAEFLYKTTDYWAPEHERTLAWDDPALAISWPLSGVPSLSAKDKVGATLDRAEVYE